MVVWVVIIYFYFTGVCKESKFLCTSSMLLNQCIHCLAQLKKKEESKADVI